MYVYLILSWWEGGTYQVLICKWKTGGWSCTKLWFDTHNLVHDWIHDTNLTVSKGTLCWWGAQIKLNHHDKLGSINLCTNKTSWQALSLCIIFWQDLEDLWLTWMLDYPLLTSTPLYMWRTYTMKMQNENECRLKHEICAMLVLLVKSSHQLPTKSWPKCEFWNRRRFTTSYWALNRFITWYWILNILHQIQNIE